MIEPQPPRPTSTRSTALRRNGLFVVIVGGVLVTFLVLGQQGRPPDMPTTAPHRLQIDHNGSLTGFVGEQLLDVAAAKAIDRKAVEKRVNTTCQSCHGGPGDDPRIHACGQTRCLPANHPPKSECIKCHRMPSSSAPPMTSTK